MDRSSTLVHSIFDVSDDFFDRVICARRQLAHDDAGASGVSDVGSDVARSSRSDRKDDVGGDINGSDIAPGVHEEDGDESHGDGVAEEAGVPPFWLGRGARAGGREAGSGLRCGNCNEKFNFLEDQRRHFKSDWHRLNVKRGLRSKLALTEEEFAGKVGRVDDGDGVDGSDLSSISGSDDDGSSDSEEDDKNKEGGRKKPTGERDVFGYGIPFSRVGFWTEAAHSGLTFSLWRALLVGERERFLGGGGRGPVLDHIDVEERLRRLIKPGGGPWIILLSSGGHFAGLVADSRRGTVLHHCTFHRYVVRAKAGSRQSTRDATGHAPKSAGASLRRYNEAALERDIRELLGRWQHHIRSASTIFVRAASSADRKALFAGESPCLKVDDQRVRRIPFATRRPTFNESKRVVRLLARIEWHELAQPEDARQETANVEHPAGDAVCNDDVAQACKSVVEKDRGKLGRGNCDDASTAKSTSASLLIAGDARMEELACEKDPRGSPRNVGSEANAHNREEFDSGRAAAPGRTGEGVSLSGSGSSISQVSTPAVMGGVPSRDLAVSSPLHLEAASGNEMRVRELLEGGADPCARDARGRTPYLVAANKETRNVFRRIMAENPDQWDWRDAGVPSALTSEMEESQAAKKAEKDAKRKAKEKEKRKEKRDEKAAAAAAEAARKAEQEARIAYEDAEKEVRYGSGRGSRSSAHKKMDDGKGMGDRCASQKGGKGTRGAVSQANTVPLRETPPLSAEAQQEALERARARERQLRADAALRRIQSVSASSSAVARTEGSSAGGQKGAANERSNRGLEALSSEVGGHKPVSERRLGEVCDCCATSLVGRTPFFKFSFKYCCTTCLRIHQQAMAEG